MCRGTARLRPADSTAVTASDHLGPQFMPVADLLRMPSYEALANLRERGGPSARSTPHGESTTVMSQYPRKAVDLASFPDRYRHLDEPLRAGTIDPVMIAHDPEQGADEVFEGSHRIVRAHQLGIRHLPVTRGGFGTQLHAEPGSWGAAS